MEQKEKLVRNEHSTTGRMLYQGMLSNKHKKKFKKKKKKEINKKANKYA